MTLRATDGRLFPSSDQSRPIVWAVLHSGSFFIGLASIIGAIIFALHGLDDAPFFVVTSSVIAGTLGLFARSPLE